MTWLRTPSTEIGILILLIAIAIALLVPAHAWSALYLAIATGVPSIIGPQAFWSRAFAVLGEVGPRVLESFRNFPTLPPSPARAPATQEHLPMSEVSSISDIIAEAPDFLKVVEDGAAVFSDVKSKGVLAGFADIEKFQPDLVKVYNDIKALGVSQAVAAGAVVVPPARAPADQPVT